MRRLLGNLHLRKLSLVGLLLTAISTEAQQPPQPSAPSAAQQGPRRYARGQYKLLKEGNSVHLFLPNSAGPINLTTAAPNMYVSSDGVMYSEVITGNSEADGLYETSNGLSPEVYSAAAVAAARRNQDRPAPLPEPVTPPPPLAVSVSRDYPVHDFAPTPYFASNVSAVIDFNGTQVPVWGLNEKIGVKATFVNGHLQWYRSQVDGAPDGSPLPDTGIYGVKPDESGGWRVEKFLIFPPELQLAPMPVR